MRASSLNIVFSAALFSLIFAGAPANYKDLDGGIVKCAYAQEEQSAEASDTEAEIPEGDPEVAALARSQLEALNAQVRDVSQSLGQAERSHFGIIYTNYNVYSTVKAVRQDVEMAVNACIENNPEMEERITARWNAWTKSVDANMKEAKANIDAMTLAQNYASQENMNTLFGLVDSTRQANSSRFEKVPVSTPEACEFMLSKMDETQDNMNMMLIATIKSYPAIMKKMQE